jgi:histidinol-phosphate aminotransferase/imidazoleglycerol-phosphate dehydratase/histidinol-phosphatase
MRRAPFPPLVPGADGLQDPPVCPEALRRRMAEVYGAPAECVLPVRGEAHALELVLRRLRLAGGDTVACTDEMAELIQLGRIYGVRISREPTQAAGVIVTRVPYEIAAVAPFDAAAEGREALPLMVVDESAVELLDTASLAPIAAVRDDMVVIRSLSIAYGLAGSPCGAIISSPAQIERFAALLEPCALPAPVVRLAEAALSASRAPAVEARIALFKAERRRMLDALTASAEVRGATASATEIFVEPVDLDGACGKLARFAGAGAWRRSGERAAALAIGLPEANDRILAALGVEVQVRPRRRAEVVRDTKETRIAVAVDLDASSPHAIRTGVGFYDHMLDQVAAHGGFALTLACEGDLEIDPHHTIEDCALALGSALRQALGERRGIARFGFVLPMDEAEAQVSIDLGGRPYSVFDGAFAGARIGAWPTEMTAHVFRSLAESMGAAIHVSVKGENDHHKTEACFKAFGRALRQAVRVEGEAVPSTKGVL